MNPSRNPSLSLVASKKGSINWPAKNITLEFSNKFPSQYGKMKVRNTYGRTIASDIDEIKRMLSGIRAAQSEVLESLVSVSGGGSMSEELIQKVHSIDVRLTRTETLVEQISSKLDKMDTKLDNLATKDFVEKTVGKSENSTMKWIIGTGFIVAALVVSIIKLF